MAKNIKEIIIKVTDKGSLKVTTKEVDKLNAAVNKTNAASGKAAKGAKNLDRNMKGAAKMSSNASKNFSKQAQGMQGVLVPAYAEVAARVFALTAAYTALERAADFAILQKGQAAFAASTGKNMASIARNVQKASGYMLDFQDASTSTALATTAGLTAKQIERMTKGARAASVALGRNMADAMDRLTRGIVKAEPEILDELGVIIRLDKVYKDFALSIGKSTTELTEMEKLTARNVAIMGQLEDKFGDIATTIPANAFSQLSASVLDLVKGGGALIANFFNPFISALSQSSVLLGALLLLIGKNLLGKVFPVFDNMGTKLDKFSERMGKFQQRMKSFREESKKATSVKALENIRDKDVKAVTNSLKKMGVDGGKLGGKYFAKAIAKEGSVGAALLGKNVIANIRKSITAGRKDIMQYGPTQPGVTAKTPGMEGQTLAGIGALSAGLNKVTKSLKDVAQATKGTMAVDAVNYFSRTASAVAGLADKTAGLTKNFTIGARQASFLSKKYGAVSTAGMLLKGMFVNLSKSTWKMNSDLKAAVAGMSKMQRAGLALALTMKALSTMLGLVVGAMSAFMMIKWIGQEFMGLSKAVTKAHDGLDGLNTTLQETIDLLAKAPKKSQYMGASIIESVSNKQFKSNLMEGITTSLDSAMKNIDVAAINNSWVVLWVDSIFEIFGAGLKSKLEETISKALVGIAGSLSAEDFSKFIEESQIEKGLKKQFERSQTDTVQDHAVDSGIFTTASVVLAGMATLFAPVALGIAAVVSGGMAIRSVWKGVAASFVDVDKEVKGVIDTLGQVNKGILTPELALEQIANQLKALELNRNELIQTYVNMTEASAYFAKQAKKESDAIKRLSSNFDKLLDAQKAFVSSLIKGGTLRDWSKQFEATLQDLEDKTIDSAAKLRKILSTGTKASTLGIPINETRTKYWDQLMSNIEAYEKGINGMKRSFMDPAIIKKQVEVIENLKTVAAQELFIDQSRYFEANLEITKYELRLKKENRGLDDKALTALANRTMLTKVIGSDATKLYEAELLSVSKVAKIQLKLTELKKFGNSTLAAQVKKEIEILTLQKQQLKTKLDQAGVETTQSELDQMNSQLEDFDTKIRQAGMSAEATVKHLADISGVLLLNSVLFAAQMKDGAEGYKAFKIDTINKDWNAFNNSLNDTFAEEQKILKITDDIKNKFGELTSKGLLGNLTKKFAKAFPDEKNFKNIAKWVRLSETAQGKTIKSRLEAINQEEALIVLRAENFLEHDILLAAREKMAKLDLNISDKRLQNEKEVLKKRELELALAQLEADLLLARQKESTAWLADAFSTIADSFESAISSVVSDYLMQKETPDWQATLAQGLSDSVGDAVGSMAKNAVFGNEGLLSSGLKGMGYGELADALFPKTDVQTLVSAIDKTTAAVAAQTTQVIAVKLATEGTQNNTAGLPLTPKQLEDKFTNADGFFDLKGLEVYVDKLDKNMATDSEKADALNKKFNIGPYGDKPIENLDELVPTIIKKVIPTIKEVIPAEIKTKSDDDVWDKFKSWWKENSTGANDYDISSANMLANAGGGGDMIPWAKKVEPKKEMDWAAGQIDQGIAPSITKILTDIDAHIKQSQQFLNDMAAKTLDSLDTLISFEIAVPLEDAALDIGHFVDILDSKIVPIMDKLEPVLDKMPSLIDEMTITLKAVNDWIGPDAPDAGKKSDGNWWDIFSNDAIEGMEALSKPGSGEVRDRRNEKKLEAINVQLKSIEVALQTDYTKQDLSNQTAANFRRGWNPFGGPFAGGGGGGPRGIMQSGGGGRAPRTGKFALGSALTKTGTGSRINYGKKEGLPLRVQEMIKGNYQKELANAQGKSFGNQSWHGQKNEAGSYARTQRLKDIELQRNQMLKEGKPDYFKRIEKEYGTPLTQIDLTLLDKAANILADAGGTILDAALTIVGGKKANAFEEGGMFWGTDSGTPLELLQRAVGEYFSTTGKIATVDFGGKIGTREFNYTPDMGLNRFNQQTYAAGVETNNVRSMNMEGSSGINSELLRILKKLEVFPQDAQRGQPLDMDVKDLVESLKVLMGDKLSQVIEKLPDSETANSANLALVNADASNDGIGTTIKNPDDISNGINGQLNTGQELATSIGQDAQNTLKQGFQSVVTNGHLDAKGLAQSFIQRASGKVMDSLFDNIFGAIFSANGNVLRGGFQAFAKGGLVTKPTLGLVGEGKYNEAVVPLPDGRSIPISGATGNTENNVTVNVTIDSDGNANSDTNSGMDGDTAKQLGYMVSQAVQSELVEQKRPGGLLSQY